MPKIQTTPEKLRPYIFHGVQLYWREGDGEAVGTCPWCGADPKFSVNIETGLWRCFICRKGNEGNHGGGNAITFLRMLWALSFERTPRKDYAELAAERRLAQPETLMEWQLARSVASREWLVPGFDSELRLQTLYKYVSNGKRKLWMPTPTIGHYLLGLNLWGKEKQDAFICEGLWDSSALWETIGAAKDTEQTFSLTANRAVSLLANANVVGLPTCGSGFTEAYCELFAGKNVYLMCQNDHDKAICAGCKKAYSRHDYQACPYCRATAVTEAIAESASYAGMRRVAQLLAGYRKPPAELNYLKWGTDGWSPALKSGYDLRDYLST